MPSSGALEDSGPLPTPLHASVYQGAAELARRIAAGDIAASEVVDAHIRRIEAVDGRLNAVVVRFFDEARKEARQRDAQQQRGERLGPLHGVPVTVKECFHVAGSPSTMGLTRLAEQTIAADGVLVRRLRAAGAVIVAKTNTPLLMLFHETDNPLHGRTNNPWNEARTPGGSSGGEAALIAAGGSPLGLGSDLGGSIRVPCHFSGICGIKPTSQRLPREGAAASLRGMEAIHYQPGPLARRVEDLTLAMRVLTDAADGYAANDVAPAAFPDPANVSLASLRIGKWTDDGYFPACPAVRRAVDEAAAALQAGGAAIAPFQLPDVGEAMRIYFGLCGADGGADARRLLRASRIDARMRKLVWIARTPRLLRAALVALLRATGQRRSADLAAHARARSADAYWRLTRRMHDYAVRFWAALAEAGCDAVICPPHALPAMPHGVSGELLGAASYSMLFNFLQWPAGVVPWTLVNSNEHSDRSVGFDYVDRLAAKAEIGSAGLPVGVQVAAPPWREEIVLAVMQSLEQAARFTARPPL